MDLIQFDLAYLFFKHMSNVIKERQRRALMYEAILTKIFIAFRGWWRH
jgi:hypothetical protein